MKQSRWLSLAVVFLSLALVFTLGGCGGEAREYSDPSVPIVVEEGQEFSILLESNPTTGYQWQLTQPPDEAVLSLVKTEFEETGEEGLVGAGGEERWTFKAEGRGRTTLYFVYIRPWEDGEMLLPSEEEGRPAEGAGEEAPQQEEPENAEGTEVPQEPETGAEETDQAEMEEWPLHKAFEVVVKKEGSMGEEPKEYKGDDTEIEVERDFKFSILLESSPSAGSWWQLAQPLDDEVVELVKTEYHREEKKKSEEAEGETTFEGAETWTFEAVGEGETEIHFQLVDTTEEKVFKVKVHSGEEEKKEEDITHE